MIVLGESNLVLELALEQEEAPDVECIVALAERRLIELVVPACALSEPYETLIRRWKERDNTLAKLENELRQLQRSREFAHLAVTSRPVLMALENSEESETGRLAATIRRLLACATVPPLSKTAIAEALEAQTRFKLAPQDSMVFASLDEHLRRCPAGPKLLVNKNCRDFEGGVEEHFKRFGCKLMPKFRSARQLIEHVTRQSAPL